MTTEAYDLITCFALQTIVQQKCFRFIVAGCIFRQTDSVSALILKIGLCLVSVVSGSRPRL